MGRQRKANRNRPTTHATSPTPAKRHPWHAAGLATLALVAVVAAALWLWPRPDGGFQQLVGRWQRADGGYVLEITAVDGGGRLAASYFNPKPIHVAQAVASRQGTTTTVFVELRDVNYPGSTYALVYNGERDTLDGTYFQALEQQRFEVAFTRLR